MIKNELSRIFGIDPVTNYLQIATPMTNATKHDVYRFSGFVLDRRTQMLSFAGERVALTPKASQLLFILVERAPDLVTRDELRQLLWSQSAYIEFEGALNACMRQVRVALGDTASDPRYVETLPRRGYRFAVDVRTKPSALSRPMTTILGVAVVIGLIVFAVSIFIARPAVVAEPKILAILPVESDSGSVMDPVTGYGIAMITSEHLASLNNRHLAIVNSRSLRQLIEHEWDPRMLSAPDYVVRISIEEHDTELILAAVIQRGHDGEVISTFSASFANDLSAVTRLAPEHISGWVKESLELEDDRQFFATRESRAPYMSQDLVLAWWHLDSGTLSGVNKALEQFNEFLEHSPNDVWALEGKITALTDLLYLTDRHYPTERLFADLENVANHMLDQDIYSGKSYRTLGFVSLFRDWDIAAANNHIEAALMIAPDDAHTHGLYAAARAASGDTAGSVVSASIAERLDPAAMAVRSDRCFFLLLDQRFDEAVTICEKALSLAPNYVPATISFAYAQYALGNEEAALQMMTRAIREDDKSAFAHGDSLPVTWRDLGCKRADELLAPEQSEHGTHFVRARYLGQCGRTTESLEQLELSIRKKEVPALFTRSVPEFTGLRDDPRYKRLLRLLP